MIPRVSGWPLVGNAREMDADPAGFIMRVGRANGGLAEIRRYRETFVVVTDPEYVRQVLVARHQRYRRIRAFGLPQLGESLLTLTGVEWQQRRRQVGSAFRFDMLDRVMPLVREETDRALGHWEKLAREGTAADLADEVRRLVILGLTRAMLSGMSEEERHLLADAVLTGLRLTRHRHESPVRFPLDIPTPANNRLAEAIRGIDGHLHPSVIRRRAAAEGERRDMLDALLAARDPDSGEMLTDAQVIAELKGLLAAGIDTTASLMTCALQELIRNPDATIAWLSEVDREFDRRLPERGDLSRLQRTTQILNETLRVHPPIPTLGRECIESDVIGGHVIPRGTRLLLSILAVHHDERYWPDPEVFRPSRFTREWPTHAFLPFGAGQHGCVSNNFVTGQVLMTLAMIGRRFRLSPVDDGKGAAEGPAGRRRESDTMKVRISLRG